MRCEKVELEGKIAKFPTTNAKLAFVVYFLEQKVAFFFRLNL